MSIIPLPPLTAAQATDLPATFRAAARILAVNGHYQGDYVPDAFDREMDVPHCLRPMSIVAALRTAVSGDPHVPTQLADGAVSVLALRLDDGPEWGDIFSLEVHVAGWGDVEGRTTESVCAVLYAAADAAEGGGGRG